MLKDLQVLQVPLDSRDEEDLQKRLACPFWQLFNFVQHALTGNNKLTMAGADSIYSNTAVTLIEQSHL